MVTISGSRLSHHNIDYPLNHKNLGAKKPFELVILQGGSGETNTENERKNFSLKAKTMIDKIHKAGAETALYMTHAYVEPHEDTDPQMIKNIKKMYISTGWHENNGPPSNTKYGLFLIILSKRYEKSHVGWV